VITPDVDGFDLRSAGPNWISNGAPHIVGGGPGAVPLDETDMPPPWQFGDRPDLATPDPASIAQSVEIVILDTVPSHESLENAYKYWIGDGVLNPTPPPTPENTLLYQLLSNAATGQFDVGATGQVEVIYPFPDLIPPIVSSGHEYPMSSHGLFIASIIRSLAPQAKVRLIRVLDSYCGGTVESVHRGLEVLTPSPSPTPLVINCSFVLRTPRAGDPLTADTIAGLTPAEIDVLTQGLHDALIHVAGSSTLVVAAAGNEGRGGPHPLARFPAAFTDVIGVGALNDDDPNTPPLLASYSDQADDQLNEGFAAFAGLADLPVTGGGTGNTIPPITSQNDAIIGAFIDPWPEPIIPAPPAIPTLPITYNLTENTSGLARWAGTSFATPIVVAALANRLSRGDSPSVAIAHLKQGAALLAGGASAIEATQG
jgi:hypothetical protein